MKAQQKARGASVLVSIKEAAEISGITRAPVSCATCSAPLVPSATVNAFSNEDDWWVCASCVERVAPELGSVLRALRGDE